MLARKAERPREVQFVGINTQNRQEAAVDLLTRTGVTYPQLFDVDAVVLGDTRVPGLPVTLTVDADGRIVDKVIGEVSRSELDTLLGPITEGTRTDETRRGESVVGGTGWGSHSERLPWPPH